MRAIYNANTIVDAHLVRHALEAEGIDCHVSGGFLSGGMGELPVSGLVQVWVSDADVEAALGVAARIDQELAESAKALDADDEGLGVPVF